MDDVVHLKDFLESLEGYESVIPTETMNYYLQKSGIVTNDPRLTKLISLATHKFLSDLISDSLMYQRVKNKTSSSSSSSSNKNNNNEQVQHVLTMNDLADSLHDFGIHVPQPDYYCNQNNQPTPKQ